MKDNLTIEAPCSGASCSRSAVCERVHMESDREPIDYAKHFDETVNKYTCGYFGGFDLFKPVVLTNDEKSKTSMLVSWLSTDTDT